MCGGLTALAFCGPGPTTRSGLWAAARRPTCLSPCRTTSGRGPASRS